MPQWVKWIAGVVPSTTLSHGYWTHEWISSPSAETLLSTRLQIRGISCLLSPRLCVQWTSASELHSHFKPAGSVDPISVWCLNTALPQPLSSRSRRSRRRRRRRLVQSTLPESQPTNKHLKVWTSERNLGPCVRWTTSGSKVTSDLKSRTQQVLENWIWSCWTRTIRYTSDQYQLLLWTSNTAPSLNHRWRFSKINNLVSESEWPLNENSHEFWLDS